MRSLQFAWKHCFGRFNKKWKWWLVLLFSSTKRRIWCFSIFHDDVFPSSVMKTPNVWLIFLGKPQLQVSLQWTGWTLHAETEWTLVNLHKSKISNNVILRLPRNVTALIRQVINKIGVILLCGIMKTLLHAIKRKSPMLQCCCAFHQWLLEYEAFWMHLFESQRYGGIHFDPKHRRITTRSL